MFRIVICQVIRILRISQVTLEYSGNTHSQTCFLCLCLGCVYIYLTNVYLCFVLGTHITEHFAFINLFIPFNNFVRDFIIILKFIYLFLAALGLCCCAHTFSSCSERGLFFVAVRGLLIAVASLVAEHGLQAHGLQ